MRWRPRHHARMSRMFHRLASWVETRHPVTLEGLEGLPEGPALMVGNHGHLGYEMLPFCAAMARATGRQPRGLADRRFFDVPLLRDVLVRVGAAYGHPSNARRLLRQGHWVVCHPGGMREALKRNADDRYRLRWAHSRSFIRVAIEMGVPVVPFAAAGVDHTFDVDGVHGGSGKLLFGRDDHDLPRLRGGRLGLLPRAVPFLFRFGEPLYLGADMAVHEIDERMADIHAGVWSVTQRLLDETMNDWRARHV